MDGAKPYDVIVVGGGPAGATAAYLLSKGGVRVCLIEKKPLPRFKLCGGLITRKTARIVEEIFGTSTEALESRGILHHQSHRYTIYNTSKALVYGRCAAPFSFVERSSYDHFCLNKAGEAGAEIVSEEGAASIDFHGAKVTTHRNHCFKGRFLLGADGVYSRTRMALARAGKIQDTGYQGMAPALEAFIPKGAGQAFPESPSIYFGFNPWGYAWSFPGRDGRILGMCSLKGKIPLELKSAFEGFLATLGITGIHRLRVRGYALPYGNYLSRPGFQNILLIGDAAGLADPLLGEGIYYAHKSGVLAAQAILKSRRHPSQAAQFYCARLEKDVLVEMRWARHWRGIVHALAKAFDYRILGMVIRLLQQEVEETLHGKRTFRWLRTLQRS